jgi:hypothetical protein
MANKKIKTKGKLRISAGAGEGYEISGEVAARYAGNTVKDALSEIIQEDIHDPHLLSMLQEPQSGLELFGNEADGECEESPLSLNEKWDRVLKCLEEGCAEVGFVRKHRGGVRVLKKRWKRHQRAIVRSFPYQSVTCYPPDHSLSEKERNAIRNGKAISLHGCVIAKIECICKALKSCEAFWYYLASKEEPDVIQDLIIPQQSGSSAHCKVEGKEVLRISRKVRKCGLKIVAAGHSHGWGGLFSSGTDRGQMSELADESVGKISITKESIKGSVKFPRNKNNDKAFEMSFKDKTGAAVVKIKSKANHDVLIDPEDLEVEFHRKQRRAISCFSTHNSRGKHLFPLLLVESCTVCGAKHERFIEAENVQVYVIGAVEITKSQKKKLKEEVKRVKTWSYWSSQDGATEGDVEDESSKQGAENDDVSCLDDDKQTEKDPDPFYVHRRGSLVGTVPAVVMERAAAETHSLATALGWDSEGAGTATEAEATNG